MPSSPFVFTSSMQREPGYGQLSTIELAHVVNQKCGYMNKIIVSPFAIDFSDGSCMSVERAMYASKHGSA